MILWYDCNNCMKEFSHVFTGHNDLSRCKSCSSDDIKRLATKNKIKGIYL